MDKEILKGLKIGFGFILSFTIFFAVYAVGFHIADEILPGSFDGDFEFNGTVNFTNANVVGITYSCPTGFVNVSYLGCIQNTTNTAVGSEGAAVVYCWDNFEARLPTFQERKIAEEIGVVTISSIETIGEPEAYYQPGWNYIFGQFAVAGEYDANAVNYHFRCFIPNFIRQ